MQKYTKIKIPIYVVFLLTILLFLIKPSASQTAFNWKWSPQVTFRLPAYNTIIAFNDYIYMDSFTWDMFNATSIMFNRLLLQGETQILSSLKLSVQNANLTVLNLTANDKSRFLLNAPSGTTSYLIMTFPWSKAPSTLMLNNITYLPCATLDELNMKLCGWYFDVPTSTIYVKARHSSPVEVYIDWAASGAAQDSSGAGFVPGTSIQYSLVVKAMNGSNPLSNVKIEVDSTAAFTDSTGTAVFLLPAGTYTVTATYNGEVQSKQINLTANDVVVFNFEVQQQPPTEVWPMPKISSDTSTLILMLLAALAAWLYMKEKRRRR